MKAAYCRRELGEVKQAAEELRAVLADYPTDEAIAVPARSALVVCLMKQKAYDEALQVLQEAEGLETPDTALQEYLRFLRPECLAGQGKHAEALELYRQFLQEAQQPALQELAEWGVAQCLEHTGPLEEARAAVENFLEKYPQSSHAPEAKELLKRLSS
jgi:tetratricopeptide (TPR) repeat protein